MSPDLFAQLEPTEQRLYKAWMTIALVRSTIRYELDWADEKTAAALERIIKIIDQEAA